MFNFFKKKQKTPTSDSTINYSRPVWLNYMTDDEYQHFVHKIEKYFKDLDLQMTLIDGVIKVEDNDRGLNNLGISNISQTCAKADKQEYERLLREHFDSMQKIYKFNQKFDRTKNEYDLVSEYIGVRLITTESIGVIGKENVLIKQLTSDLSQMLIYDLPDSTVNIKPSILATWSKSKEEVFVTAYENCRRNYSIEPQDHNLEGVEVKVFTANHFFSPSVLLFEDEMQKYTSEYGSICIVPTRNLVMIYPITDLGVVDAVNKLIAVAHGAFRDGPGSLSPKLFWYANNMFTELPYRMEDKLVFSPPQNFVDMLNLLTPTAAKPDQPKFKILPRIKADYSHDIYANDSGKFLGNPMPGNLKIPEKFLPIIASLTADLSLLFAIDTGDQYTIINNEFLEQNPEYNVERLKAEATTNLVKEIGQQIKVNGDVTSRCMITCGGNFEAALLLLDFWDQIHDQMGEEIYMALPTRDVLFAASMTEENRQVLMSSVKGFFDKDADYLTSKALYIKRKGSLELRIDQVAF